MKNIERLAHKKLEEILLDTGVVPRQKLEECLRKSRASDRPLEEILIHGGILDEDTLAQILSTRLQLPYLSLENYGISTDLIKKIPKSLMLKHQFVPIDQFEEILTIITANVPTYDMLEEIQVVTQSDLFLYIGKISEIARTLEEYKPQEGYEETSAFTKGPQAAELTTGWESIFDMADKGVQDDLRKKGEEAGTFTKGSSPDESAFEELFPQTPSESLEDQFSRSLGEEVEQQSSSIEDAISRALGGEEEEPQKKERPKEEYRKKERPKEEPLKEEYQKEEYARAEDPEEAEKEIVSSAPPQEVEVQQSEPQNQTARMELAELSAHLSKNLFDYDAINQYVELCIKVGDIKAAVRQLTLFAWGLDQAGKDEEAVNCYEYILELDPDNREARRRLER